MTDELIDREEYRKMREKYTKQIEAAQRGIQELEQQRRNLEEESTPGRVWMEQFLKYRNLTALSREVVVSLVDRVYVHENKQIHIDFNFRNEVAEMLDLLRAARKEAV